MVTLRQCCRVCGADQAPPPDLIPSWAHVPHEYPEVRVDKTDYPALVARLASEYLDETGLVEVLRLMCAKLTPEQRRALLREARAA